jgi:predicted RNase H-like HicB family nuclease
MATYLIELTKTSTGYSAHCRDVLGCVATGKTVETTLRRMRSALKMHFAGLVEDGDPLPRPGTWSEHSDFLTQPALERSLLAPVQIDLREFRVGLAAKR